jgi:hypothetical protein
MIYQGELVQSHKHCMSYKMISGNQIIYLSEVNPYQSSYEKLQYATSGKIMSCYVMSVLSGHKRAIFHIS